MTAPSGGDGTGPDVLAELASEWLVEAERRERRAAQLPGAASFVAERHRLLGRGAVYRRCAEQLKRSMSGAQTEEARRVQS